MPYSGWTRRFRFLKDKGGRIGIGQIVLIGPVGLTNVSGLSWLTISTYLAWVDTLVVVVLSGTISIL